MTETNGQYFGAFNHIRSPKTTSLKASIWSSEHFHANSVRSIFKRSFGSSVGLRLIRRSLPSSSVQIELLVPGKGIVEDATVNPPKG